MAQNWMGLTIDFEKVEDKTSEGSGFELLQEGFYRATIKSVNKSELGQNHRPALTITMTLDDFADKEIVHSLYLPEQGDSENAIKFKNENLRNFFTRFAFRQLTKEEYEKLDNSIVNVELQKIMTTMPNFVGGKVLIHIKQEPFVSRDRETKAIKWTSVAYNPEICTKAILKLVQELEQKGIEVKNFPVFMFSNKVAAHGFGFYNDYNETAELKNNKSYDFVVENGLNIVVTSDNTTTNEVPSF